MDPCADRSTCLQRLAASSVRKTAWKEDALAGVAEDELQVAANGLCGGGRSRPRLEGGRHGALHRRRRHAQLPRKGGLLREMNYAVPHIRLRKGAIQIGFKPAQATGERVLQGRCAGDVLSMGNWEVAGAPAREAAANAPCGARRNKQAEAGRGACPRADATTQAVRSPAQRKSAYGTC